MKWLGVLILLKILCKNKSQQVIWNYFSCLFTLTCRCNQSILVHVHVLVSCLNKEDWFSFNTYRDRMFQLKGNNKHLQSKIRQQEIINNRINSSSRLELSRQAAPLLKSFHHHKGTVYWYGVLGEVGEILSFCFLLLYLNLCLCSFKILMLKLFSPITFPFHHLKMPFVPGCNFSRTTICLFLSAIRYPRDRTLSFMVMLRCLKLLHTQLNLSLLKTLWPSLR